MGEHTYPSGTVFGPGGQPGHRNPRPSPPDFAGSPDQSHGYQEVEALEPDPSQGDPAVAVSGRGLRSASAPARATLTKVLNVARSQLGYTEGPNNDNKYGLWYGWNHVAYCAIGQTWTFAQAGGLAQIEGIRGQAWAYCPTWVDHFQRIGRWHHWTDEAKPGDIVFYDWDGNHALAEHVETVESIEYVGSIAVLVTIGFNTTSGIPGDQSDGGGVFRRRRSLPFVVGYGRPEYAPQGTPTPIQPPRLMPLIIDGVWGRLTTRHLQVWLTVQPDGVIGPVTRRRLQEVLHIPADGIWGPQTHKALQHRLGVPADGDWGRQTARALQRFLNRTV